MRWQASLMALLLALPGGGAWGAGSAIGEVTALSGEAIAQRGGGEQPLRLASTIESGDVIATGEGANVTITFNDDSEFTLGAASRMTIDKHVYNHTEDDASHIRILKGFFRFTSGKIAKAQPQNVTYKTPVSILGIRGSEAFGEVKPDGTAVIGMTECCIDHISQAGVVELDEPNTFSKTHHAHMHPSYPAQCNGAWLNKVGRALGVEKGDRLYAHVGSLEEGLTQGQWNLNLRARFERVVEEGFGDAAQAVTLRTALDYKTATYKGFNLFGEVETVTPLGARRYNDAENGKPYPVVWDADSAEINQLYAAYEGTEPLHVRLGRQHIAYDNERFVGNVAFRQDDQSFDAVTLHDHHFKDVIAQYAYAWRVNRIFSEQNTAGHFEGGSHFFNLNYSGLHFGALSAYAYLVDLEEAPLLSSATYGLRFTGSHPLHEGLRALYTLEFARQRDHADNPAEYDAGYAHIAGGFAFRHWRVEAGFESLGGDGARSFTTPLATLHRHNGFADTFLVTPPDGLEDRYISTSAHYSGDFWPLKGTMLHAAYHDFSAEDSGMDYGAEWDIGFATPFLKHYTFEVKYADYHAESFGTDANKLWVTLSAAF